MDRRRNRDSMARSAVAVKGRPRVPRSAQDVERATLVAEAAGCRPVKGKGRHQHFGKCPSCGGKFAVDTRRYVWGCFRGCSFRRVLEAAGLWARSRKRAADCAPAECTCGCKVPAGVQFCPNCGRSTWWRDTSTNTQRRRQRRSAFKRRLNAHWRNLEILQRAEQGFVQRDVAAMVRGAGFSCSQATVNRVCRQAYLWREHPGEPPSIVWRRCSASAQVIEFVRTTDDGAPVVVRELWPQAA